MNNKRTLIFTLGCPASGKSTWAKQYVKDNPSFKRIERDSLREMFNDYDIKEKGIEELVTKAVYDLIILCFKEGYNVILSDTNLNTKFRNKLITEIANRNKEENNQFDIQLDYKEFTDVPLQTCLDRNRKRKGHKYVPERVIKSMYEKYIAPFRSENVSVRLSWYNRFIVFIKNINDKIFRKRN